MMGIGLKLFAIGGSITMGRGAASPAYIYYNVFTRWLNTRYIPKKGQEHTVRRKRAHVTHLHVKVASQRIEFKLNL